MKLILDLDEKTIENMQGYADTHGVTINEVVENLFNTYIQEPANIIDEYGLEEIRTFMTSLTSYLNETILDMESLIGTSEEYEDDKKMIEVFKVLNRDVIHQSSTTATLFKTYKGR